MTTKIVRTFSFKAKTSYEDKLSQLIVKLKDDVKRISEGNEFYEWISIKIRVKR